MNMTSVYPPRYLDKKEFEEAYNKSILNNNFFEKDSYYIPDS